MIRPLVIQNRQARRARVRGIAAYLRSLGYGSALALLLASGAAQAQQPQPAPRPQRPEAQRPESPRPAGEDEIEVIGQEEKPPVPTQPSLPRFTGSLLRTPQVITVIPQGLLQEQGATTLRDALRNVTGIGVSAGEGGAQGDNFTLRGYSAQNDTFIDGVRDRGSYFRDSFNLEAVEVVKGPSSSYFGRGATGGVINQVAKSPLIDPAFSGSLTAGNGNYGRVTGDVNVPLGETTALRLNAMGHTQSVVDRDDVENRRYGFAPSLAFGLGTPTQFTLSYLQQHENNTPDYGLPYRGGSPLDVDRSTFYGLKDQDDEKTKLDVATARFDQQFGDQTRLRNTTSYIHVDREASPTAPRFCSRAQFDATTEDPPKFDTACAAFGPVAAGAPLPIVMRRNRPERDHSESILANQTDLVTEFATGALKHTFSSGVEFSRERLSITRFTAEGPASIDFSDDAAPLPTTAPPLPPGQEFPGYPMRRNSSARTISSALGAGVYVGDQIEVSPSLDLVAGLRWDLFKARFENEFRTAPGQTGPDFESTDRMLSYRAGLVFHPSEAQSYYVSYGTSFNPSAESLSLSANNQSIDPEENRSFELGSKWLLFNDQLNVQAALFQIEKTDARENDPIDANNVQILSGKQRVRGLELGISGRITADWEVFAGYTLLRGKVTKSDSAACRAGTSACIEGNELGRTPRHSASLWTTFTPFGGAWTFGGGPTYVASRLTSTAADASHVPSFVRWDSMISYRMSETMSLRLNIQNLTDTEYFVEVGGGHAVPAPGRSFILSSDFSY